MQKTIPREKPQNSTDKYVNNNIKILLTEEKTVAAMY